MKIHNRAVWLIAILLTLMNLGSVTEAYEETTLQQVDELLTQGENVQAWASLQRLSADDTDYGEALWRMARTQYEMGRLAGPDKDALRFFQESEKYARAAIAATPDRSDGYKWLAIALGAQSKYTDTKTQVKHSREIKSNIEKAIVLAPDDDISYLVLSRWHYKMSGLGYFARVFANMIYGELPKASLEESEKLLLQAIGLHDRVSHRYNLYKVYARMNRDADAKVQLEKALILPVTFPEEAEELTKAREKLEKNP
jgi:tetratricopeptide (TPR) repeat protein